MTRKQTPPFSIQIELNEGCNLGCSFCGLRGMREDGKEPWYPMKRETVERIISEVSRVGWHCRFIFSMHGEPTLNKNAVPIIRMFRKAFPKSVLSMMSNGYGIVHLNRQKRNIDETIKAFRDAGLNDLIIDYYGPKGDAAVIETEVNAYNKVNPEDSFIVEHLQTGVKLYSSNSSGFRILFNPPIQNTPAINRHLCNHCGAAAPLDMSYNGKRCVRPFRELTFRYDGSVALCCNDFRGEYPIGNILTQSIEDIWYSKRFEAARILLYAGERTFTPCLGCNALSHRVGLLPDMKGQETMPEPTDKIRNFAKKVSKNNQPLCGTIYKRSWEE